MSAAEKEISESEPRGRVLLAEDSPDAQALMRKSLEKIGFEVVAVDDGHLCLEKFTQSEFNLVVIDFVMPKLNGLEVLREIRKHRAPEELPVIMITAKQKKELVKIAIKNGVNDFFIKPVKSSLFSERINQHLLQFTGKEITKILHSLNVADSTSLSPKLKAILSSNQLSAYPFEYQGVKCCALIENGKNPHVLARQDEKEIKKQLTLLGKGGFLWNVIWPIGEKIPFQFPRDIFNNEEDLSNLLLIKDE